MISDVYANKALDACYGSGRAAAWPATVYLAAFTGDPSGSGVEISGGGYARIAVANSTANWPAAVSRSKLLATDQAFPTSTGAWSDDATHWALFDAGTGGALMDYAQFQDPVSAESAGSTVRIPANTIVVTT